MTTEIEEHEGKHSQPVPPHFQQEPSRSQQGREDSGEARSKETMNREENKLKNTKKISAKIEENKKILEEKVGADLSFDVILREMTFASKSCMFFYLNGFVKDEAMTEIMKRLSYVSRENIVPNTIKHFVRQFIPHVQVEIVEDMDKLVTMVLSGGSALFIEKETQAIVIDAKSYPVRSIEEPQLEKVVRGSRDGFTETMLTNVTLMRRRIRDPRLKLEAVKVGKRTKTDVCVAYISDIADLNLVHTVKKKLGEVNIDGIPLADKQLEEALIGKRWNPFPMVRYSERPDVVSNHLLEGHVVLFVDTSPSVIILPTTFFHLVQHAEEYRQAPSVGTYLRWVRFIGIFASLFLLPLWFLMVAHPEMKPYGFGFLGPQKTGEIPIIVQFFIIELGVDLVRMAAVHTPTPLATAMGLIAAIMIGNIAVDTGLFINEVILYMAVATIGMFATPSYELGMANRIVRLLLLTAVAMFKVPGLMIAATVIFLYLVFQRSFNTPYMWPFIPFNASAMMGVLFRQPLLSMKVRPSITKPVDSSRQPG